MIEDGMWIKNKNGHLRKILTKSLILTPNPPRRIYSWGTRRKEEEKRRKCMIEEEGGEEEEEQEAEDNDDDEKSQ